MGTGLKKWRPRNADARPVAAACSPTGRHILDDRFDDQVGRLGIVDLGRELDPCLDPRRIVHQPLLGQLGERPPDPELGTFTLGMVGVDGDHMRAGGGAGLRDAGTHLAGAYDCNGLERHI